jgi:hypothetical protein
MSDLRWKLLAILSHAQKDWARGEGPWYEAIVHEGVELGGFGDGEVRKSSIVDNVRLQDAITHHTLPLSFPQPPPPPRPTFSLYHLLLSRISSRNNTPKRQAPHQRHRALAHTHPTCQNTMTAFLARLSGPCLFLYFLENTDRNRVCFNGTLTFGSVKV